MHSGFILISLGRIRVYARNDNDHEDKRYNDKHDENVISRLGIRTRNGNALGIFGSGAIGRSRLLGLLGDDLARKNVSAVAIASKAQFAALGKIRYSVKLLVINDEGGIFALRKAVIGAEDHARRGNEIITLGGSYCEIKDVNDNVFLARSIGKSKSDLFRYAQRIRDASAVEV